MVTIGMRCYFIDELDRLRKDDELNEYYDAKKVNEMTRKYAHLKDVDKGEKTNRNSYKVKSFIYE